MRKNPFLIFAVVTAALIAASIVFIQSPRFARFFKGTIAQRIPSDLGVEGDFSEFAFRFFPPGISLRNPRLRLQARNFLGLPEGSTVRADRIDFIFRPVQMFSGDIRVHEVSITGGDVDLVLADFLQTKAREAQKKGAAKPGFKPDLHWDELLQVRAEAVSIHDTRIRVRSDHPAFDARLQAQEVRIGQWSGKGGLGYEAQLELTGIEGQLPESFPKVPRVDLLRAEARVNAAGLQLGALVFRAPGLEVLADGAVRGNVISGKGLELDGRLKARTEVARVLEWVNAGFRPALKAGAPARGIVGSGTVQFDGQVKGQADRLVETLRLDGKAEGEALGFEGWSADRLQADFSWRSAPDGGEVAVKQAVIESRDAARVPGPNGAPGGGGRIEVGAFRMRLDEPFKVPLKLHRAHIHWLAAPGWRPIFPFQIRVSGPVDLAFTPAAGKAPWQLGAHLGLEVENLSLDNQKPGLAKPLHQILSIPKIQVAGGVIIDPSGLRPDGLRIKSGRTDVLASGRVDFKKGFDLGATGEVHLEDVGQIAENDIRGEGTVKFRMHGPISAFFLDFDTDLTEASYLKLAFGDLKGRITWDDDRNRLIFTGIEAQRGETRYGGDGVIDLDKDKDTIAMKVAFEDGELQDLLPVFAVLTDDIWWFPRSLAGEVSGTVVLDGGIRLNRLGVHAQLTGHDWLYLGERLKEVSLRGGYDKGRYAVDEFQGGKRNGRVQGRISLDPDKDIDWSFRSDGLSVGDFDHVAQLDVPMRGRLALQSAGRGKLGTIRSASTFVLSDFAVRGVGAAGSELSVRTEGGRAELKGSALGGQGVLDMNYGDGAGTVSTLRGTLKGLDFSPILLLLNPKTIQDRELLGRMSGALDLRFPSDRFERASGEISLSEYVLAKAGTRFELDHPVAYRLTDGTFDIADFSLRGPEGVATLNLRSRQAALEGALSGDLHLSIAEFFTPVILKSSGVGTLDLAIRGGIRDPRFAGQVGFNGASMRLAAVESPIENIVGKVQLHQNVLDFQGFRAELAGGPVDGGGRIELFADRYPTIALKAALAGNKLKIFPFQYVKVRGSVGMRGDRVPYLIDGSLAVESALSTERVLNQKKTETLKSLQYTPPPSSLVSSDYPKFKLDIAVNADKGIVVQNDLFDLEAKGKLRVVNTLEAPRILGSAEVVAGKLLFKDRAFAIQSASAEFDSPTVLNPRFSLVATTEVSNSKIQMYAAGRLDKWKIDLTSNPVMAESEILSLLALGTPSGESKRFSPADRSALEQGEAASLLLHSLDFNREVQSKTGIQIQLDEATLPQQGSSIFKPQNLSETSAQPKITIRRRIGKSFDLSVGTTVGGANTNSGREVNAEYHFNPGFSVLGVWSNYQSTDATQTYSIGLDLKFQARFK